jgi:hypothetical protein
MRTSILQIIKRMILLMTPLTKGNSIIRVKSKRNTILKRKDMMCFQVLVSPAQDTSLTVPGFHLFYPVLIFFGVSHFIYIFAFGDVYLFIFIYHKVVPLLWVAIYTKRLKSKIVKYNIFYDYLIKRKFGCDKYLRPQQITYEYFLLSKLIFKTTFYFNHSIKNVECGLQV